MPTAEGRYFCFPRVLHKLLQCTYPPKWLPTLHANLDESEGHGAEKDSLTNPGNAVFSGYICLDICLSSLRVVFSRSGNFKSLRHLISSAMRFDPFGDFQKLQSLQYQPKNIKTCRSSIKYQSLAVYINQNIIHLLQVTTL